MPRYSPVTTQNFFAQGLMAASATPTKSSLPRRAINTDTREGRRYQYVRQTHRRQSPPPQPDPATRRLESTSHNSEYFSKSIKRPPPIRRNERFDLPPQFGPRVESRSSPNKRHGPLPRTRPPLATLSTNLVGTNKPRPLVLPTLCPSSTDTRVHRTDNHSTIQRSTPRKLLWPSEVSTSHSNRPIHQSRQRAPNQKSLTRQPHNQSSRFPIKPTQNHGRSPARRYHPYEHAVSKAAKRYHPNFSHKFPQQPLTKTLTSKSRLSTPLRSFSNNDGAASEGKARVSLIEQVRSQNPARLPLLHVRDSKLDAKLASSSHSSSPSRNSWASEKSTVPPSALRGSVELQNQEEAVQITTRKLSRWEIWMWRIVFSTVLIALNISLLAVYLVSPQHHYLLAFLVFMKSKDLLSTVAGVWGVFWFAVRDLIWTPKEVESKWIMSTICAYAESEDQVMKTVSSLVKQELVQHKQVICVILDGKPKDILSHFTRVTHTMKRSYTTWKSAKGQLQIWAGMIDETPIILIQKEKNAGKKDTLILAHDLFNYKRNNAPVDTKLLRHDIFTRVLPGLTGLEVFEAFDCVYATDADSVIHKDCLKALANALSRNPKAIAACGIIIAELTDKSEEWSAWHLFQQFQYTFGQYVRRQAESVWGRVTCLPGPVTMVAVRPEMAKAISDYANPVLSGNLFLHQVQYQGTDRRLTWCMLSQNRHLKTVLVPEAIGETVVPSSLEHYLSQRRRWAANAYFNDYMYAFGKQQHPITRLFALIDIVRMSFVFYRVMNTGLFIRSLVRHFYVIKIVPTLILTKTPTTWFLVLVLIREPVLRKRLHKVMCGIVLNQFMSPVLSVIVFSRVLLNMGNHAWGRTGVSSKDTKRFSTAYIQPPSPRSPWSPRRLVNVIRAAIKPSPPRKRPSEKHDCSDRRVSELSMNTSTTDSNVESRRTSSINTNGTASKTPSRNGSAESLDAADVPPLPQTPFVFPFTPMTPPVGEISTDTVDSVQQMSTIRRRTRHPTFLVPQ